MAGGDQGSCQTSCRAQVGPRTEDYLVPDSCAEGGNPGDSSLQPPGGQRSRPLAFGAFSSSPLDVKLPSREELANRTPHGSAPWEAQLLLVCLEKSWMGCAEPPSPRGHDLAEV